MRPCVRGIRGLGLHVVPRARGALAAREHTALWLAVQGAAGDEEPAGRVLAGGFGHDPHRAHDDPVLFSGCYFAAIGETEDRQAFAKGVFNKLLEEQEQVEWTPRALRNHRRYLWAAYLGLVLDAGLVLLLGAMIALRFFIR